jgi:asparagine synthase (glutamine-hydrolysing)
VCGIAGTIGLAQINGQRANDVLCSLTKRGPDGSDVLCITLERRYTVNFLFTRLSIIDLHERAMQPMTYGNYSMVINGEIYNYKYLRAKIESDFGKQQWTSTGDVEVALRYIHFYGLESIREFDGMFALAILDAEKGELSLARDFFGEKPLYYLSKHGTTYFASEPKAIWKLLGYIPTINLNKVTNTVVNGYKSIFKTNDEWFAGLQSVKPGHIVKIKVEKPENYRIYRYKEIPGESRKTGESREEILKEIRKIVINSVGLRLESDVPIAISLSGGIDSGLIAAIAKRDFGVELKAFTIASKDPRYSEAVKAAEIAKFLQIDHSIIDIPIVGFLSRLKDLIHYHDSPISTISYFIQSHLMEKISKDGFKVSLMGSGADEIFSGYYDHHLLYLAEMKQKDEQQYQEALKAWKSNILPLIRNPIYKNHDLYIENPKYRDHIFDGADFLKKILVKGEVRIFQENLFTTSLLKNRMLNELFEEVIPVILKEDDRNSMKYSVENRSPYLSHEILAKMISVDVSQFIKNGKTKSILREAFDGYLPKDIMNSFRKIGFNASFSELCDINSSEFKNFMNDDSIFWTIVQKERAQEIFESLGKADYLDKTAFNIVSSKAFLDTFYSENSQIG